VLAAAFVNAGGYLGDLFIERAADSCPSVPSRTLCQWRQQFRGRVGRLCLYFHDREACGSEERRVASFLQHKQKTRPLGALFAGEPIKTLLDLGFLEFNVLAYNRVILRLRHLVRERTAVLGGDVEGTGVGCRQQLDLDCCSFRHGRPAFKQKRSRRRFSPRLNLARNYVSRLKSQVCFALKTKRKA
jgi:hypothetical protein